MKEMFLRLAITSYATALAFLVFVILVDFPQNALSKNMALIMLLVSAITVSSILLLGWSPRVEYPYPDHRRKAIILWAYSIPLTALIAVYSWQEMPPFWVQIIVYFLSFFLITTLTFGILPGYGGAYNEYWELEQRRGQVGESTQRIRATPINRDRTIESVTEVCRTCLTAVLSDDVSCWRCGNILRWEERFRRRWTEDPRSRWKRKKKSGQVFWERTWYPDYVRVDEQGHLDSRFRVPRLFAFVIPDGKWSLLALVDTFPRRTPNPILLDEGREPSPRDARRRVNRIVSDVDFEKIIEEY